MNAQDVQSYLIPAAIVLFFGWRFFKYKKTKALMPKYVEQGAIIVDVRSAGEFSQGCSPRSVNIPLGDIAHRAAKELDKNKPIVLCCASGARSGAAVGILKAQGFKNVINAGPWTNTLTE